MDSGPDPREPEDLERGKKLPYTLCHFNGYPGIRARSWCKWEERCDYMHFPTAAAALRYLEKNGFDGDHVDVSSFAPLLSAPIPEGFEDTFARLRQHQRDIAERERLHREAIDARIGMKLKQLLQPEPAAREGEGEGEGTIEVPVNEIAMRVRRLDP